MRNYEKISCKIMEKGDMILKERKNRAAKIKHISYAASGICAAVIVAFGIKTTFLSKKPSDILNSHAAALSQETTSCSTPATVTSVTSASQIITTADSVTSITTSVSEVTETVTENVTEVTETVSADETITDDNSTQTEAADYNVENTSDTPSEPDLQSIFHDSEATFSMPTAPISMIEHFNGQIDGTPNDSSNDNTVLTKYEKENTIIPESEIGDLIRTASVQIIYGDSVINTDMEIYSISDDAMGYSVAVKLPDTNIYYKFTCPDSIYKMIGSDR